MSLSLDPFTVNKICDKQTKHLINGYIRKGMEQTTSKHQPVSELSIITLFYYYSDYFSPETYIKPDQTETISIKPGTNITNITFDHEVPSHQKIEVEEGEYENLNDLFMDCYHNDTLHFVGIGDKNKIIWKYVCITPQNTNIYIENMTIESDNNVNFHANIQLKHSARLWLKNCVIKINGTAISVDEHSSLYVKDCIFAGDDQNDDKQSESAILISPFANQIYIVNSTFKYCAKQSNFFGRGDDDYYACIDVNCWSDKTGKEASVKLFAIYNSFINNYGYPFAKKLILGIALEEEDDKINWFERWNESKSVQFCLQKNIMITHRMKNMKENERIDGNKLYSKLFVDIDDPVGDHEAIAEKTDSIIIRTNIW